MSRPGCVFDWIGPEIVLEEQVYISKKGVYGGLQCIYVCSVFMSFMSVFVHLFCICFVLLGCYDK